MNIDKDHKHNYKIADNIYVGFITQNISFQRYDSYVF